MKRFNRIIPIITILALLLVSLATSCDRRNPPPILPAIPAPPPASQLRIITKIVAAPDTIYADNNITYSEIAVTVKNGEGFGVPSQIVSFKTNLGRILTNVPTDSTGVAKSTFWDDGDIGVALITAVVRNYSTANPDSVVSADTTHINVTIISVPPIQSVTLNFLSNANPYPMTVMQTTELNAHATNILGNPVPNNTLITFFCTKGRFVDDAGNILGLAVVTRTINGRAYVKYNAGVVATTTPGVENAFVSAGIGTVMSTREVVIRSGAPAAIGLQSFVQVGNVMVPADTSFVSSPNHIFMRATLNDSHGNPCQTKPVRFETNLGTFLNTTQTVTINTQANGEAQVRFTPGLSAGAATIKAFANGDTLLTQLIFNVTSDDIHSISFTQIGQIDLNVANTGGTESAILRVKLKDINGNLIDSPQNVYFRIVNTIPPAGANLNNQPVADSVLVVSSGGEAQISVNSGTESGILVIRASVVKNNRWIRATKANIVIHAGPPAEVRPFIGGFNTGQNMGGGLWRVVGGAVVKDTYGNPVDRGTSVFFELIDNVSNCQIGANAYVGNVSVEDDSLNGVAYTTLSYSGIYTNDWITVRASTGTGTGAQVDGYATLQLPLNDPRLEAQANPAHLNFGATSPDTKSTEIYCVLTDGQGLGIGNSDIMLLSTKGQFVAIPGFNNQTGAPAWKIRTDNGSYGTGEFRGWAWGQIRFFRVEVPAGQGPPVEVPGQTSATVIARLLGTNITAETSVILYRYWTGATPPP
ncbi:MAG: hypothetical protein Q8M98_01970 [Candidatus Cloacimonadaceae bacterium]|nr:hypothetical protein [Candidatus Cloacimonadaceae bacterium]MDP3113521.1 hypothetical protein [Candidatus Cloacimonadaceae bacterium]